MATGFFNDKMDVFKVSQSAEKAIMMEEYKQKIANSIGCNWIVGHTRHATRGAPAENINNHPVFIVQSDKLLVHNGWIVSMNYDREPKLTDSRIPLHIIENDDANGHEHMLTALEKVHRNSTGDSVFVIGTPTTLGFFKTKNRPLEFHVSEDNLYFASTDEILSVSGFQKNFTLGDYVIRSYEKGSLTPMERNLDTSNITEVT
ncbi:MAG: hypothetical protein Q6370_007130 [Candidatus Sigynarchaeota archaeon]